MAQGEVGAHCCSDAEAMGGVRMQCLPLGRIVGWEDIEVCLRKA